MREDKQGPQSTDGLSDTITDADAGDEKELPDTTDQNDRPVDNPSG